MLDRLADTALYPDEPHRDDDRVIDLGRLRRARLSGGSEPAAIPREAARTDLSQPGPAPGDDPQLLRFRHFLGWLLPTTTAFAALVTGAAVLTGEAAVAAAGALLSLGRSASTRWGRQGTPAALPADAGRASADEAAHEGIEGARP